MSTHPPGEERDILLLKLKTIATFAQSLEEKLSVLEMDLLKASALYPDDPTAQTLFLAQSEIRPGDGVPSHSLVDEDLERAAQNLGVEFIEKKKQAWDDLVGLFSATMPLNREGATPERLGPFVIQFHQAAAALLRIGLQPALHLRGQFLVQLERPVPVLPTNGPRVPGSAAPNRFQRKSKNWTGQYGSDSFIVRNGPGATYIHYLLERPHRKVPVSALAAAWDRVNQTHNRPSGCEREANRSCDDGPLLDKVARQECQQELERIDTEMEEADKNNDTFRLGNLKAERQQLAQEFTKATKPGGKPVLLGDRHHKLTNTVSRAIQRTILSIKKDYPALGTHLASFISTGVLCTYAPTIPTQWET